MLPLENLKKSSLINGMSKVQEIIKKKNDRKNRLLSSLDLIVDQLKKMGALKIVLFGSLMRDEVDINSDLDLFVLMPSTKTGKEWFNIIYDQIERKVASDIIVYNENEFNEELQWNSLLTNISKGKVIYEKV
jgi:predicted nucleotidyltransferase